MPQYDNSMRGVLFKNDKKQSDKHPDYKGNGEVNGVEVWISAWIQKSKKGVSYMSLQFENKEGQVVGGSDVPIDTGDFQTAGAAHSAISDDDIPF